MHDKQLVDDIPVDKLLVHDVPVDIVCTPSQVFFTNTAIPKPQGWSSFLLRLIIIQNTFVIFLLPKLRTVSFSYIDFRLSYIDFLFILLNYMKTSEQAISSCLYNCTCIDWLLYKIHLFLVMVCVQGYIGRNFLLKNWGKFES